ncbi:unnamed protein product [Musa acuminata subsp. burmannicoides]
MGISMKCCFLCSKNCDQLEKKSDKEDDKILPTKTYVLKLHTCCVESQKKIKKLLHKIDGVYAIDVDAKEKKVTVTGNVDPAILFKKLHKIEKIAELLATKDGNQENTQAQKKDVKSQEGSSGGGEGCSGTKLPVEEKQTCVLKVHTCCVECRKEIRKVLLKIDGVYAIDLDIKEEKVTVTGNVDPAILIKKLRKIGKVAELVAPKDENQEHTQPQKEDVKSREGGSGEGCSYTKLPVEEKQTCVLKVHTCCVGCQTKIRKVLLKIDGVHAIDLDVKEERVIVTGNVDPAILIKKLRKVRKVAELLATKDENQENIQEDVESQEGDSDREGCNDTKRPVEGKKKKKKKKKKEEANMNEDGGDEERVETHDKGGEQSTTYLMQQMEQHQYDEAGVASLPPPPPYHEGDWPLSAKFSDDNPSSCLIM